MKNNSAQAISSSIVILAASVLCVAGEEGLGGNGVLAVVGIVLGALGLFAWGSSVLVSEKESPEVRRERDRDRQRQER